MATILKSIHIIFICSTLCYVHAQSRSHPPLVTNSTVCLSYGDCPSGHFCDVRSSYSKPFASFTCLPFRQLNETCNQLICAPGLHCAPIPRYTDSNTARCKPAVPVGSPCRHFVSPFDCVPGTTCSQSTERCEAPKGSLGSNCISESDCSRSGLYCHQESNFGPGKCRKRIPTAAKCTLRNNFECEGDCVAPRYYTYLAIDGRCAPRSKDGGKCYRYSHCETNAEGKEVVCNQPQGAKLGICSLVEKLIKKLGVPCNPKADRCDARRGLSCRWGGNGLKWVCAQRGSDGDSSLIRHCTPGHILSSCKPREGLPTVCRKSPDHYLDREDSARLFPVCALKLVQGKPGDLCYDGDLPVQCTQGSKCTGSDDVYESRQSYRRTAFCIKNVGIGMKCDGIGFNCQYPYICGKGGTCQKKKERGDDGFEEGEDGSHSSLSHSPNSPSNFKYLGFGNYCKDETCAPGLVCKKKHEHSRVCDLPTRISGEGGPCFETTSNYIKCKSGLSCNLNFKGSGIKACRKLHGTGGYCRNTADCKEGLECGMNSKCGPKVRVLKTGEMCDPNPKLWQPRCHFYNDICAKKNNGLFVCQTANSLYDGCDDKRNITCDGGSKCSNYNVCV